MASSSRLRFQTVMQLYPQCPQQRFMSCQLGTFCCDARFVESSAEHKQLRVFGVLFFLEALQLCSIDPDKRACVYISRHLPSGWQLSPWDCFRGLPVTRPGLSAFAQETSKARLKGG